MGVCEVGLRKRVIGDMETSMEKERIRIFTNKNNTSMIFNTKFNTESDSAIVSTMMFFISNISLGKMNKVRSSDCFGVGVVYELINLV